MYDSIMEATNRWLWKHSAPAEAGHPNKHYFPKCTHLSFPSGKVLVIQKLLTSTCNSIKGKDGLFCCLVGDDRPRNDKSKCKFQSNNFLPLLSRHLLILKYEQKH